MNTLPNKSVRIGYHRVSDDSVSSGHWKPGEQRDNFVKEILASPDIDRVWWRDAAYEVNYIKGTAEDHA